MGQEGESSAGPTLDRDELWRLLELNQTWAQHHHDALWEEEKHYAWWVSVLLPVLALIYWTPNLGPTPKQALIVLGSSLGALLSVYALIVVRREGVYLFVALQALSLAAKLLGLTEPHDIPGVGPRPLWPHRSLSRYEDAALLANRPLPSLFPRLVFPFRSGIRDVFQLTFLLFFLVFAIVLIGVLAFPPPDLTAE